MTTRRELLIALSGALAAPFNAQAQPQSKMWRVGYLSPALRSVDFVGAEGTYGAFVQSLRELGLVEGKNLIIEWRTADGDYERLSALAAELVNLKVDVIVTPGTPAASAAQKATSTIPIVMVNVGDPIGAGFIKSLARPGGNITGVTSFTDDLTQKRLDMLLAMTPRVSRLAVLVHPANPVNIKKLELVQAEAQRRGLKTVRADARTPREIDQAFTLMRQEKAGALMVFREPLFQRQRSQIAALAAQHRLPAISEDRMYAEVGMLMSYAPPTHYQTRRAAYYVARLLKGANPADLPVENPTVFELVINGKTAKSLGLTIPQTLLISATEVIK